MPPPSSDSDLREEMLRWYAPRRSRYPWRSRAPNPYHVLVSEVMLQQTQVARVVPIFLGFLRRFPTVRTLAAARADDVLRAWSGLGYNRRAIALSRAARAVVRHHGGRIPSDPEILRSLPGVGPYTAAAVAALAFGLPVPALDTNMARVVARAKLGSEPHEISRAALEAEASAWLDPSDPASWNQALMDLGREICRPVPRCGPCPLAEGCRYRARGRRGAGPRRPGEPFPGSMRWVRGAVVRVLRHHDWASLKAVAGEIGEPEDRVLDAIRALAREGLVEASAKALAGTPRGRIRLART